MAEVDKPYRVYKGGRTKGKVPLERPERRRDSNGRPPEAPARERRPRRRWSWRRRVGVTLLALLVLAIVWGAAGYLSFRGGVASANRRIPNGVEAELVHQNGLLLSHPTTILLLGTDHQNNDQRVSDFHSDSIIVLRVDPGRHRLAYLSILRDLLVDVPGHGREKINAAFQQGGPALAVKTVSDFTGLQINHVLMVDFSAFKNLIDNIGGITVNVPERILSNPFDCPFTVQKCQRWKGWRFGRGPQHMDGRRALIYSRIRENQLNPSESDATRAQRQQAVMQTTLHKLVGIGTFFDLPFNGSKLLEPLTTDLSASQVLELGWVKLRSSDSKTLHCQLGGDNQSYDSQAVLVPSEDKFGVIREVLGQSAPQPPRPGSGPYGSGCVVGNPQFRR